MFLLRLAFERGEKLIGIRFAPDHLDKTGIQFPVRLFRLAGALLWGRGLVDAVFDKEDR